MLRLIAFLLGIILLTLNLIGLTASLRSSSLASETSTYFVDDLSLTESEFYAQLADLDVNNRPAYLVALTQMVGKAVLHYWRPEGMDRYNLRLPWTENYLLRAWSYIDPTFFQMYEFRDYHRALARGVGLCSQHSIIESGLLREQGIDAKLIELNGHVILTAEVDDGQWWLLDPDYGVVVPMSLSIAEDNVSEVGEYYARAGYSDYDVDRIEELIGTRDNQLYDGGAETYLPFLWWAERASYVAKWVLPVLLMLPWLTHGGFYRLQRLRVLVRRRARVALS